MTEASTRRITQFDRREAPVQLAEQRIGNDDFGHIGSTFLQSFYCTGTTWANRPWPIRHYDESGVTLPSGSSNSSAGRYLGRVRKPASPCPVIELFANLGHEFSRRTCAASFDVREAFADRRLDFIALSRSIPSLGQFGDVEIGSAAGRLFAYERSEGLNVRLGNGNESISVRVVCC